MQKPLFKATYLNSISIIIKISIGFITSKFIALFVGPSGMALVGNLRNFLSSTEAVATLGFENGIVKYVAERKNDSKKLQETLSTVFISVFLVCCLFSIAFFLGCDYFNQLIFGTQPYASIFKALALALPWYIGNLIVMAVINGLGQFKKVIYINSIGSLIGLLISVVLIWQLKTIGALFALILAPTILFLISFYIVNKEIGLLSFIRFQKYRWRELKNFLSFSLMALVSSVATPVVLVAIRNTIIQNIGLEEAGYWEAMSRISSYYLLFISSIIGLYFLPKMAVTQSRSESKKLFLEYYKKIIPVFIMGILLLYFLRYFVIQLLFTRAFLPVTTLFFWQLLGDLLKAIALILGYQFYAKKKTKAFIIIELSSLSILYCSSLFFMAKYQIEGVVIAHAFTYLIYLLVLLFYYRKEWQA